ncbi:MAG: hypothetical protein ACX94B_11335 [Henriciella sp.]|nr:hypothetical protein [Hyphomonadaceae bacterium]
MSFRFNDELLLSDSDRSLAEKSFPSVFFALDHPELNEEFQRVDALAVKAKTTSRRIGFAALIFATLSLLTFPAEPLVKGIWSSTLEYEIMFQYLTILGAVIGFLALFFGNLGLGFGRFKRSWLQKRLITERLRQWHAQYFVAHAVEIAEIAHTGEGQAAWLDKRNVAFERFKRMFIDQIGSEYAKYTISSAAAFSGQSVTDPRAVNAFWIDESWAKASAQKPEKDHKAALDEVYRAYQETRMLGQIQYTNYVLSADGAFWASPSKQLHILGNASYVLVILAFMANFVALVSAVWPGFPVGWPVLSSLAITFAIVAVGVRAMLEGLRPERETRRMQFYASALNHASTSFDAARTHAKRMEAMKMLERASYDEMVEFISSNEQARFVL